MTGEDDWSTPPQCCCEELHLYDSRAYLAAWMCFKNDSHPALGDCKADVYTILCKQMPSFLAEERRTERERAAAEQARIIEEAAAAWARQEVRGTDDALQVRRACESLGAALWHAGADVEEPLHHISRAEDAFEGLLANTTAIARADEEEDEDQSEDDLLFNVQLESQYDDVVLNRYVNDYRGAKELRRAAHGAPRRLRTEKAWVGGEKVRASAPARARRQKQALVVGARQSIADVRRVRTLRRSKQANKLEVDKLEVDADKSDAAANA